MKNYKRTIELTNDEHRQLVALSRKYTASYKLVMRSKLILLVADGKKYRQVATQLEIRAEAVTKWVKRWCENKNQSVESRLADLPRSGSPTKFTTDQKCKIIAIACEKPEVYDLPITHWSNRELAKTVIKQGIVDNISPRHVGHLLKKTM